jgi:hypothetical protein
MDTSSFFVNTSLYSVFVQAINGRLRHWFHDVEFKIASLGVDIYALVSGTGIWRLRFITARKRLQSNWLFLWPSLLLAAEKYY